MQNRIFPMLQALKRESNVTRTENGAKTLRSTGAATLDLFATIGALRTAEDADIIRRFERAWAEDHDVAMKMLFYARDIRGGLGERRVFRTILRWMAVGEQDSVMKNIPFIGEYGRYDDLLALLDTPCEGAVIEYISRQLNADMASMDAGQPVSLLAKWLPSVNASNTGTVRQAKLIAKALGMSDAQYRKMLSALRSRIRILENNLREKDYTFDYASQPSKAMFKYRRAFIRNDGERYISYITQVSKGEAVLHTGTLMPYDLIRQAISFSGSQAERQSLDVTWNALEDYTDGRNALVVVDGSGSMYWGGNPRPGDVALSLGIYFAEHNTGAFHNHFITFSMNPRLIEIKGDDLVDKVRYCRSYNECANTNVQKVFELILEAALKNHLPQSELPETLYFISDMEFDCCSRDASLTHFEYAKTLYGSHGYKLPKIVFWNVQSRSEQQPVKLNEQGVMLVSGASPRVFSMVMEDELDPYDYMMQVLGAERYAQITA